MKTTIEVMEIVHEKATEFATRTSGRYKNYVSDEFIVAYIESEFCALFVRTRWKEPQNLAYASCVTLFEELLEHRCKVPGNGHHVAQAFAAMFKDVEF